MERAIVKEQLETLVGQMVERGILLEEAVIEFEKRFIKRALERALLTIFVPWLPTAAACCAAR